MDIDETNQKNKLIQEGTELAIFCLKHFFELLDLDPEQFNHIYSTPVKIGKLDQDADGEYIPDENLIIINDYYLDEMLDFLYEFPNNEKIKNSVISDIAIAINHEMLHANRAILIEHGLNAKTIIRTQSNDTLDFFQKKSNYDLAQYRKLLAKVLEEPFSSDFSQYIPIKIKLNTDNTYDVVAYNCKTGNYNEFSNQHFNINMENGGGELFYQIGIELNNNKSQHKETKTIVSIPNFEDINDQNRTTVVLANDYYHPYSKSSKIVGDKKIVDKKQVDIETKEFSKILDDNSKKIITRLDKSDGLEECITETLANMIVMSKKSTVLDLDSITNKIINSNTAEPYVKETAKFIQHMGKNMIKWFLTSVYSDNYNDYLENEFKENYDNLVSNFNDLYESRFKK